MLTHPEGLRKSEIARRIGVHRSTIGRYIDILSTQIPLSEDDHGLVTINSEKYLSSLRISLNETMALHLGCQLLIEVCDSFNPNVTSALRKIGSVLKEHNPVIGKSILKGADRLESDWIKKFSSATEYESCRILECLTIAWSSNKKVRITYVDELENLHCSYLFSVYYLTISAQSRMLYVFGTCEGSEHILCFKLAHITRCETTAIPYSIPKNFDPYSVLLQEMHVPTEAVNQIRVKLCFNPELTPKVLSKVWRYSQTMHKLKDGRVCIAVDIPESQDLYTWIRSLGSEIEILSPDHIREEFITELQRLNHIYNS